MMQEEFTARYMPQFSEQQKAAVMETEGPVLLLAVPGSGKTTVLVTRLGYMALCCGIDPARILAVTYTVAATRELRARFTARFPDLAGRTPKFRTGCQLKSLRPADGSAAQPLNCWRTPENWPHWSGASIRN